MNLIFSKDKDDVITAEISHNKKQTSFDYVEMIKILYTEKEMGACQFKGDFSKDEQTAIGQMVQDINKLFAKTQK
jgi:hypothetical protein